MGYLRKFAAGAGIVGALAAASIGLTTGVANADHWGYGPGPGPGWGGGPGYGCSASRSIRSDVPQDW